MHRLLEPAYVPSIVYGEIEAADVKIASKKVKFDAKKAGDSGSDHS